MSLSQPLEIGQTLYISEAAHHSVEPYVKTSTTTVIVRGRHKFKDYAEFLAQTPDEKTTITKIKPASPEERGAILRDFESVCHNYRSLERIIAKGLSHVEKGALASSATVTLAIASKIVKRKENELKRFLERAREEWISSQLDGTPMVDALDDLEVSQLESAQGGESDEIMLVLSVQGDETLEPGTLAAICLDPQFGLVAQALAAKHLGRIVSYAVVASIEYAENAERWFLRTSAQGPVAVVRYTGQALIPVEKGLKKGAVIRCGPWDNIVGVALDDESGGHTTARVWMSARDGGLLELEPLIQLFGEKA